MIWTITYFLCDFDGSSLTTYLIDWIIFPYLTGLVILETTLTGARPTIKLTNDEANSGNLQRLILMIFWLMMNVTHSLHMTQKVVVPIEWPMYTIPASPVLGSPVTRGGHGINFHSSDWFWVLIGLIKYDLSRLSRDFLKIL